MAHNKKEVEKRKGTRGPQLIKITGYNKFIYEED